MTSKRFLNIILVTLGAAAVVSQWARRRLKNSSFFQPDRQNRPTALVTGASSGIGEAFARLLASRGYDLILVARRVNRLQEFAAELHERYGVIAEAQPADLLVPADLALLERVVHTHKNLSLLINNAGYGDGGPFAETDIERQVGMVLLHDAASVRLTHAVLPGMLERGHGGVINVSSLAAFAPLPHNASYSASKAFLNTFTGAVQSEITGRGVYLQALCPGFTRSEFHNHLIGFERSHFPEFLWMDAEDVAHQSLDALGSGQVVFIPGRFNRLTALVLRSRFLTPMVQLGAQLLLTHRIG